MYYQFVEETVSYFNNLQMFKYLYDKGYSMDIFDEKCTMAYQVSYGDSFSRCNLDNFSDILDTIFYGAEYYDPQTCNESDSDCSIKNLEFWYKECSGESELFKHPKYNKHDSEFYNYYHHEISSIVLLDDRLNLKKPYYHIDIINDDLPICQNAVEILRIDSIPGAVILFSTEMICSDWASVLKIILDECK